MSQGDARDYGVGLATAGDDPAIRALLAANPVPGKISVGYLREPDYFVGCGPLGDLCQTLVARHLPSGRLAGVACRAVRTLWVNGRPQQVGYLGQLRVDALHRSRWLVQAGFRFLHELHGDGRTPFYLTTIIDGNREAEGILVHRPRRHLPTYRPLTRLHTLALPVRRRREVPPAAAEILSGDRVALADLLGFWTCSGSSRQFFPGWRQADFAAGAPLTRGLQREDLLVAVGKEGILGTLALWDQSDYKQTVVAGYDGLLGPGRPFYNLFARLTGRPLLPPVGAGLATACGALLCVREGSPATFAALLDRILQLAAERGRDWLLLGLCGNDPLLAAARAYPHVPYCSTLYTVRWDDEEPGHDPFDERPVHVEIAAL